MLQQVLFIQGGGAEGVHDTWDNKLVDSLGRELGPGYEIRYPVMPNEADPKAMPWTAAIEQELESLRDEAVIVGHSIGGAILVSAIGERKPPAVLRGVFLIAAPFIGKDAWPSEDIQPMSDLGARLPAQLPIYLYQGSEDDTVPAEHLDLYAKAIPRAFVRRLPDRNHQLNDNLSEVATDIRLLTTRADHRSP